MISFLVCMLEFLARALPGYFEVWIVDSFWRLCFFPFLHSQRFFITTAYCLTSLKTSLEFTLITNLCCPLILSIKIQPPYHQVFDLVLPFEASLKLSYCKLSPEHVLCSGSHVVSKTWKHVFNFFNNKPYEPSLAFNFYTSMTCIFLLLFYVFEAKYTKMVRSDFNGAIFCLPLEALPWPWHQVNKIHTVAVKNGGKKWMKGLRKQNIDLLKDEKYFN